MSTKKSFSGQDLADLTGVEGITFRRYIRSDGTRVGRGKKYSFDADTASLLIQGFLTGKSGVIEDEEGKLQKVEKLTEEQAEQVAKALIASEIEDEEDEDSTEDENEEPQGSTEQNEDTETEDSDESEDEDTEDEN